MHYIIQQPLIGPHQRRWNSCLRKNAAGNQGFIFYHVDKDTANSLKHFKTLKPGGGVARETGENATKRLFIRFVVGYYELFIKNPKRKIWHFKWEKIWVFNGTLPLPRPSPLRGTSSITFGVINIYSCGKWKAVKKWGGERKVSKSLLGDSIMPNTLLSRHRQAYCHIGTWKAGNHFGDGGG